MIAGAADRIFALVEKVIDSGYDLRTFHKRLIEHFRDLLIVRTMVRPQDVLHFGEPDLAAFRNEAEKAGDEDLLRYLQALQDGEAGLRYSSQPQIAFETMLVRLCHFKKLVDLKDVLAGLEGNGPGEAVPGPAADGRDDGPGSGARETVAPRGGEGVRFAAAGADRSPARGVESLPSPAAPAGPAPGSRRSPLPPPCGKRTGSVRPAGKPRSRRRT